MATREQEAGSLMLFSGKVGRSESIHVVAGFTSSLIWAVSELPGMGVGMAIGAAGEAHDFEGEACRPLPRAMTLLALHCGVTSSERKSCGCVIESTGSHLAPSIGRVTAFATLSETSFVRIAVARRTGAKLQAGIVDEVRLILLVAFSTFHFLVQADQVKFRHVVVILRCRLPSFHHVTTEAASTELSTMRIGVA